MTIKQRRKEFGISRKSMAKLLGITRKQYKALEDNTGEFEVGVITQIYCRKLDDATLERIAELLAPEAEFSVFKEAFLCIE